MFYNIQTDTMYQWVGYTAYVGSAYTCMHSMMNDCLYTACNHNTRADHCDLTIVNVFPRYLQLLDPSLMHTSELSQ